MLLGYALSPNIIRSYLTTRVCPSNATLTSNSSALVGPSSAEKHKWQEEIYEEILYYLIAQAVASVLIFILTIFGNKKYFFIGSFYNMECEFCGVAFPEAPPTPPSKSRQLESEGRQELPLVQQVKEFVYSLWLFVKNVHFMLLLLATGVF